MTKRFLLATAVTFAIFGCKSAQTTADVPATRSATTMPVAAASSPAPLADQLSAILNRLSSTGAVVSAIKRTLPDLPRPCNVVAIFPDRGDRYLDLVYDDHWLAAARARRDNAHD